MIETKVIVMKDGLPKLQTDARVGARLNANATSKRLGARLGSSREVPVIRFGEPGPELLLPTTASHSSTTRHRLKVLQVVLIDDILIPQDDLTASSPSTTLSTPLDLLSRSNSSLGPHVDSLIERTRPLPSLYISFFCLREYRS